MHITLTDVKTSGLNSSKEMYGPVSIFRENGEADFNLMDYTSEFNDFYRVRIDSVCIILVIWITLDSAASVKSKLFKLSDTFPPNLLNINKY